MEGRIEGSNFQRLGDIKINKGKISGNTLFYAWDAVSLCSGERCPIIEYCPYAKNPKGGKCTLQYTFLKSLSVILFRNYGDSLDEVTLYQIGLGLIPLYKMLCKLYIQEYAVTKVVYADHRGDFKANPVYREIRDTLHCIRKEWRHLGLTPISTAELLDPFMEKSSDVEDEDEEEDN